MSGGMPGCESFWDYLDGELPGSEAELYRSHLASCAACRLSLEEYAEVSEALRWEKGEAPPPQLREAVLEEFRKLHASPDARWGPVSRAVPAPRRRVWPAWLAAGILLGLLGVAYLSRNPAGPGTAVDSKRKAGEEHIVYRVYGPDGALKASIQATRSREGAR